MTGLNGETRGWTSLRITSCKHCEKIIYGTEDCCEECWEHYNKTIVGCCLVENAEGRCPEYYKGICEKCLDVAAGLDWSGWKRVKYVNKD